MFNRIAALTAHGKTVMPRPSGLSTPWTSQLVDALLSPEHAGGRVYLLSRRGRGRLVVEDQPKTHLIGG